MPSQHDRREAEAARERLRLRLTQRGLAPVAGLIGAIFGAESASAWVPARLVVTTVQAATRFAASKAAAEGLVSAGVISLTEAILRSMAVAPLKLAASLALSVAIAATVGWFGTQPEPRVVAAPEQARFQPIEEPPQPQVPAPIAVAAQQNFIHVAAARIELARTTLDLLFHSNRHARGEFDEERTVKKTSRTRRQREARCSSPRTGRRTIPRAMVATGWDRFTTRPRVWPVMARALPAARGLKTRTWSWSPRASRARTRPRVSIKSIPDFAAGAAPSFTDMGPIPGIIRGGDGSMTPETTTRQEISRTVARIPSRLAFEGCNSRQHWLIAFATDRPASSRPMASA